MPVAGTAASSVVPANPIVAARGVRSRSQYSATALMQKHTGQATKYHSDQ